MEDDKSTKLRPELLDSIKETEKTRRRGEKGRRVGRSMRPAYIPILWQPKCLSFVSSSRKDKLQKIVSYHSH